jgi:integrase
MVRYSKQDVLNKEERELLFNSCKNDKEELVVKGLCYTGMRAGEFAHMTKAWIDWQKEVIKIPPLEKAWHPKTKAGIREIPLMYEAKRILFNHFRTHDEIGMTRVTLYRIVRRVASRMNPFKKVYPHSLRATFASMLADAGLGPADIQMILGWAKLETANHYVRATMALQNFREKMGGMK